MKTHVCLLLIVSSLFLLSCGDDGGSNTTPRDTGLDDTTVDDAADVETHDTAEDAGIDSSSDSDPDVDDVGGDTDCNSMLAARVAAAADVDDCHTVVPNFSNIVPDACDGLTSNGCASLLWEQPTLSVSGSDTGAFEAVFAAPCVDGSMDCAIDDPNAFRCTDGSRVFYWFDAGSGDNADKWFFRVHGGVIARDLLQAGCWFDDTGCGDSPSSQLPGLSPTLDASQWGLFNPDEATNPAFHDWNRVYFDDRCFSDNHEGDSQGGEPQMLTVAGFTFPVAFMGSKAILGVARSRPEFTDATDVVVLGYSGGGRFPINFIDRLADDSDEDHSNGRDGGLLRAIAPNASVVGVVDGRFQPGFASYRVFANEDATVDFDGHYTGDDVMFADVEAAAVSVYDDEARIDYAGALHMNGCRGQLCYMEDHDGIDDPDCDDDPSHCPRYAPAARQRQWSLNGAREIGLYRYTSAADGGATNNFVDLFGAWDGDKDLSCQRAHLADPRACQDWMHVLMHHVNTPVFVRIGLHEDAYRSPSKIPSYTGDDGYYLSPLAMRKRVRKQLHDIARDFGTRSELATGADDTCGATGCNDLVRAIFAVDSWLHQDPTKFPRQSYHQQLAVAGGDPISLADALVRFVQEPTSPITLIEGDINAGVTKKEHADLTTPGGPTCQRVVNDVDCWCQPDVCNMMAGSQVCVDGDGDGLIACQDPDWGFALDFGSAGALWDYDSFGIVYADQQPICRFATAEVGGNRPEGGSCWPNSEGAD